VTAAQVETENNDLAGIRLRPCPEGATDCFSRDDFINKPGVAGQRIEDLISQFNLTRSEAYQCLNTARECLPVTRIKAELLEREAKMGASNEEIARIENATFEDLPAISADIALREVEASYQQDVAYLRGLGIEIGTGNEGTPMTREEVSALAAERRLGQLQVSYALSRIRAYESEYDALHGVGAYRSHLAAEAAQARAMGDYIRSEQNRATLELLCAGLICPALAALGGAVAIEYGIVTAAVNFGRPLLTYSTTTAVGGGTFNATVGAGFDYATGGEITPGSVGGDYVAGFIFNQSYLTWGRRLNNPYVRGGVSGLISGMAGETTSQVIQGNGLNGGEIVQQGIYNGIGGVAGSALSPRLNNSYAPVWQGLLTRESRYGINIGTGTAVRAGVNELGRVIIPTTAIEGTAAQGAESSFDALRNWQIPLVRPITTNAPTPVPAPAPKCIPAKEKC
jgi:hypothetical protein